MSKFFYVYVAGGTLALVLLIYALVTSYPKYDYADLAFDFFPAILLYYLAFKTYHEKKDGDLM